MQYYFNLVNGHQSIPDREGIKVADVDQARTLAFEAAAEMIQRGEVETADWRGWRMEAVDASGATLFTLRLDALLS